MSLLAAIDDMRQIDMYFPPTCAVTVKQTVRILAIWKTIMNVPEAHALTCRPDRNIGLDSSLLLRGFDLIRDN
jgi:hypothetical protein